MSKKFYLDDYSDEDIIATLDANITKNTKKNKKNKKNKKKYMDNQPLLNITVDSDENNEKVIILSLDIPLDEKTNKVLTFDLSINKNLYLLIGKELFS